MYRTFEVTLSSFLKYPEETKADLENGGRCSNWQTESLRTDKKINRNDDGSVFFNQIKCEIIGPTSALRVLLHNVEESVCRPLPSRLVDDFQLSCRSKIIIIIRE